MPLKYSAAPAVAGIMNIRYVRVDEFARGVDEGGLFGRQVVCHFTFPAIGDLHNIYPSYQGIPTRRRPQRGL